MRQLQILAAIAASGLLWQTAAQAADHASRQAQDAPFVQGYVVGDNACAGKDKGFEGALDKHKACMTASARREQSDSRTLGQIAEASLERCRAEQKVMAEHIGRCETPDQAARVMTGFEAFAQEGLMIRFMDDTLHRQDAKGVDPALLNQELWLYRELYQACVAFETRHGADKAQDRFVNLTTANVRCSDYLATLQAYAAQHLSAAQAKEIVGESEDEASGLADAEMDALGLPGSLKPGGQ